MTDLLTLGGVTVEIVKKPVKNVHLTVHPPDGRVRLVAPLRVKLDTLRLFALSKLSWIRRQQAILRAQPREPAREVVNAESHYLWGQRLLLKVIERDAAPAVLRRHKRLVLYVRPGTPKEQRQELLSFWYRDELRDAAAPLLKKWEAKLGVVVERLFIRAMKTKWGSCNPKARTIRLNTELAKKPVECLEYVLLHELAHLVEPKHNAAFRRLLDSRMPHWPHVRDALNRLPLGEVR
jgi:hypothetical protein